MAAAEIGEGLLKKNQVLNERIQVLEKNETDLKKKLAELEVELQGFRTTEARIKGESKVTKEAVEDMGGVIRAQGEQLESLEFQLAERRKALDETERERDEANAKCRALQADLEEHMMQKMEEERSHQATLETLRGKLAALEDELRKANTCEEMLKSESNSREKTISDLESVIRSQQEQMEDLEASLAASRRALHEADRESEETMGMHRSIQKDLDAAKRQIERCNAEYAEMENRLHAAESTCKEVVDTNESLKKKLDDKESEIAKTHAAALEDTNMLQESLQLLQCRLAEV